MSGLGLSEARVKDFSVCPDGGALLLTGTNGYLHMLTLKVLLLLLVLLLLSVTNQLSFFFFFFSPSRPMRSSAA